MSSINDRMPAPVPVYCDFWWKRAFTLTFTVGASHYPYVHQVDAVTRASDTRYEEFADYINTALTFDAIDSESKGNPKVIVPAGVTIVEYLWDFGDGSTGVGPVVTHTYKVANPEASISLVVTDSRGMRSSCQRYLNLIYTQLGNIAPNKLRST